MKTAEEIVLENSRDIISVSPDTTLYDALQLMAVYNIGAIFVRADDRIIGVWTERDLMQDVLSPEFDPYRARVGDHMKTKLVTAPHTDTTDELMDKFLGMRLRHLLIEKNGQYIGMLSSGDVMKACLLEKTRAYEELNFQVNWDYYENWRFSNSSMNKIR